MSGTVPGRFGDLRVDEGAFQLLSQVAERLKDRMEELGVSVPALSRVSGISASRIRRILRAQNSQLDLRMITLLASRLGLETKFESEDLFRAGIRRGMEAVRKEREAEKPLSEFKERYKITRT